MWISECTKETLLSDISAGFTVFVFLVPQGLAYALLAGMPPIYGLYSAIVPSYVYAVLGTSRQLSIGPMAITSLLLSVAIDKYGCEQQSAEYVLLTMNLSLVVGFVILAVGMFRLGLLVNLISESVLSGFLTASSCVILLNQLKYILGVHVPQFTYTYQAIVYLAMHIHQTNIYSLCIGISSLAVLYGMKNWKAADTNPSQGDSMAIQSMRVLSKFSNLLVIVISPILAFLLISHGVQLHVVGIVPSGLKPPGFTFVDAETMLGFLPAAFAIAFVAFTGNWAVATKYGAKFKHEVDATQELLAAGLATIVGSFFNAFAVSGGLARSAVNAESGAQTQLSGCISATLMLIAVQFCTGAFYYIPMSTLGAVIIISVMSMLDFRAMYDSYYSHPNDCLVMVATFLVTFFVGVTNGLFVGIAISLAVIVYAAAYPSIHILGQLSVAEGGHYREVAHHAQATQHAGVTILRMEASIFFANCVYLKDIVMRGAAGEFHPAAEPIHTVVLDASCWTDIDLVASKTLAELRDSLRVRGVTLMVACATSQVQKKLTDQHFSGHFCHYSIEDSLVGRERALVAAQLSLQHAEESEIPPPFDKQKFAAEGSDTDSLLPMVRAGKHSVGGGQKQVGYGSVDVDSSDYLL